MQTESTTSLVAAAAPGAGANPACAHDVRVQCPEEPQNRTSPNETAESLPLPSNIVTVKPKRTRRPRESKITNLPEDIRELINQKLRAHVPAKHIIPMLAEKGHPDITPNNISRWSRTGYKDWLLQRERIECLLTKVEDAEIHMRELEAKGVAQCDRFNTLLFSLQVTQAIRDFDPDILKQRLESDPAEFYRLARAAHNHSLDRYRTQRINILSKKFGIDRPLGATDLGHEAVKIAFGLPESWPPPQISPNHTT